MKTISTRPTKVQEPHGSAGFQVFMDSYPTTTLCTKGLATSSSSPLVRQEAGGRGVGHFSLRSQVYGSAVQCYQSELG